MTDEILTEQAASITTMLQKLMRKFTVLHDDDPAMNLPLGQIRVCEMLRDGARPMCALSKELSISASALTQIADRLEHAGLVERLSEVDDRRVRSLQLTLHGVELIAARREKRIAQVLKALEELPDVARETIVASLEALLDAGSQPGDPPLL